MRDVDDDTDLDTDALDGDPMDEVYLSQWDDDPNPYAGTYSED